MLAKNRGPAAVPWETRGSGGQGWESGGEGGSGGWWRVGGLGWRTGDYICVSIPYVHSEISYYLYFSSPPRQGGWQPCWVHLCVSLLHTPLTRWFCPLTRVLVIWCMVSWVVSQQSPLPLPSCPFSAQMGRGLDSVSAETSCLTPQQVSAWALCVTSGVSAGTGDFGYWCTCAQASWLVLERSPGLWTVSDEGKGRLILQHL